MPRRVKKPGDGVVRVREVVAGYHAAIQALNNKIAALLGMAGSSPGRPPVQATQVFTELNGKLDVQLKRMDKVYSDDLKAFNAALKKLGLPEVVPRKKVPNVAADDDAEAGEKARW